MRLKERFVGMAVFAALTLAAFGGEARLAPGEARPCVEKPVIWSNERGAIRMDAAGPGAWRLVHTGAKDWAFNPVPRHDVKPGEVYSMEARLSAVSASATLCAALFDAKGQAVNWGWASTPIKAGQTRRIRFMVPEGVTVLQPRLIGCGAFDGTFDALRFCAEKPVDLPTGAKTVQTANGVLALRLSEGGALSVTDRRTGRSWTTLGGKGGTAGLKTLSVAEEKGGFTTTLLDPQTLERFCAVYRLDGEKGEFTVEVRGADGNEQTLTRPIDYPAPFATRPGDRLVFPQNEGVGFPVEESHPVHDSYAAWNGSGLCMAFFGVVEDATGAGWMTILETEADASMRTRRDAKGCLSAGPQWDPEKGRFGYVRRARYVLFDKGGHVAFCKRYRAYAKQIGRWKPFSEKVKERPILDRLFGAVNVWCWEPNKDKWISDLQSAGIRRILWSGGGNADEIRRMVANPEVLVGRYDVYTDVYRPEQLKKLGRKSGCNSEAWPNDVIWHGPNSNDWTRAWGVKAKDGTWTYCATLCDTKGAEYCRRNIAEDLKTKPYNARFLDVTTAGAWKECSHPRHPMNRRESRAARERLMNVPSGEFGLVTGGETGHDFSVPFCDYYEGMLSLCPYRVPDSGRYIQQIWTNAPERVAKYQVGEKYRLPLWELVFHDCTCAEWYWGDYNNKLPQLWAKRDLFNVLYGTMGMFVLNARHWREDKAKFVRSYKITSPVARATAMSEMVDHRFLTADRSVQQTVFANGVTVTVDFARGTHRVEGLEPEEPRLALELPPGPGNSRNSEGDFIELKDGRLLYIYSHYLAAGGGDHAAAVLASRVSDDGGETWSTNSVEVIGREGRMNVMSVSLLRLKEGPIALFYLVKNSEEDCRPAMRLSTDEGRTWGPRTICVPEAEKSYYVLNNARATQLKSGRLVLPMCEHAAKNGRTADWHGRLVCYLSDDLGKTWRRGKSGLFPTFDLTGRRVTTQEPGVVELKDGRLLLYARTCHARQWFYYSSDGGETWTGGEPGSLWGPCGPATVKRLSDGSLVAIWNDHEFLPELSREDLKYGRRVPMTVGLSMDEGKTWPIRRTVGTDMKNGWYCYFSAIERDGKLLIGYCARSNLQHSRILSVPLGWLRAAPPIPGRALAPRAPSDQKERVLCAGEAPAVSPDGKRVAFSHGENGVQKIGLLNLNLQPQSQVTWVEEGPGLAAYPTFLANGDLVYTYGLDTHTALEAQRANASDGYHLRRWSKGKKTDLTSGRARDYTPVGSPDGKRVYFASTRWVGAPHATWSITSTSMIGELDLMTGLSRQIVDSPHGFNSGVVNPAISPDGKVLVWGQLDNFFGYWRLYGAKLADTRQDAAAPFTPEGLIALSPRWHPNGRLLAFAGFARGDRGWGVWVMDVKSGNVKRVADGENPCFSPDGKVLFYDRGRQVWTRAFEKGDEPTAPFSGKKSVVVGEEKVIGDWKGRWTGHTTLPLDKKYAFDDQTAFFVRVHAKTDGKDGLRFFAQGEYAESKLGFQLYRNHDAWFSTRRGDGTFAGAVRKGLAAGEHVLIGARLGEQIVVSVDGERPVVAVVSPHLALNTPERLIVGKGLHKGEEITRVEIGTGWPKGLKRPVTREEIMK